METPKKEMPKYKSHKEVWALKIKDIVFDAVSEEDDSVAAILYFEEEGYAPMSVDLDYIEKHNPQLGGYFVVYEGGYASWSPAEVFEAGYSPITDEAPAPTKHGTGVLRSRSATKED